MCVAIIAGFSGIAGTAAEPVHGVSMHGAPALQAEYTHLPYANPKAAKGGRITFGLVGTFDNLNPLIVKGVAAAGLRDGIYGNNVFESLLARNYDEPFSLYGLLAERVDLPDDRAAITFFLNPKARFSDGDPVDVEDVEFSFEILRDQGRPNHRSTYSKVTKTERVGENGIRFKFADGGDRELPLILGLMPILPKHKFSGDAFNRTVLQPVVGSGPYKIAEVDAGSRLVLVRNPDYWGRDLAVKRGINNFDEIRFDYFRDENSLFESFKKGLVDVIREHDPTRWATGYEFPAVGAGRVIKEGFVSGTPKGMFGLVFNTRKPPFDDVVLREAFAYLFDFEWVNQNLYFGLYRRSSSYFEGSELSASRMPASDREKRFLQPFTGSVRPDVLTGRWTPPATDGSGRDRKAIRHALGLLAKSGWKISGGQMKNAAGQPLGFEILTATPDQERLALTFSRALKRVGIEARVRTVDSAQYQRRLQSYDYDMIMNRWYASLSPGNEQSFRWSVKSADVEGTFNFAGARQPALDAMIAAMLAARDRDEFVDAVRAFDRVLISGFYVIPLFHPPESWVARWRRIRHPDKTSLYGPRFETWWAQEETAQ